MENSLVTGENMALFCVILPALLFILLAALVVLEAGLQGEE